MFGKSQNYKVEIIKSGRPIILRPDLRINDAIYWADRIREMGEVAYVTRPDLTAKQNG